MDMVYRLSPAALLSLQNVATYASGYAGMDMPEAAAREIQSLNPEAASFFGLATARLLRHGLSTTLANRFTAVATLIREIATDDPLFAACYHQLSSVGIDLAHLACSEEETSLAEIEVACGLCWREGREAGVRWLMQWAAEKPEPGTCGPVYRYFERDPQWSCMGQDLVVSVLEPIFESALPVAA